MPINAAMPLTVRKTILLRPHGVPWEVFSICDYNLHNVKSRPAGAEDKLTTHRFSTAPEGLLRRMKSGQQFVFFRERSSPLARR